MEPTEIALWIVMMMECWANGGVSTDPAYLAKDIGWSAENVKLGLTERVRAFFQEVNGEFVSPLLEEHWQKHLKRIEKQKEGGRKGASRRYNKELTDNSKPMGQPIGQPMGPYIKSNSVKSNSIPSPRKEKVKDPFVDAMEAFEVSNQGSAIV
jgi:hypothetical protein